MSQKVALVLSSGGARGLAHIGVIEALEANGYEISSIAGSSMGAVVGAFYAAGKLEEYKNWVLHLDRYDVFKLIDFTFSVQGFIRGEKVFKTLQGFIPDVNIEELKIPYCAIATDLPAKSQKVFTTGSMYAALKASIAIPTVIKPVVIGESRYIDGGVINPIPIEHVQRQAGDILVVSNVNAIKPYQPRVINEEKEASELSRYNKQIQNFLNSWKDLLPGTSEGEKKLGFFDLMNDSIDLMQDRLTSLLLEKHQPDMLIEVSNECASTFEFYKAKELIELGWFAFEEAFVSKNQRG